MDSNPIHLPSEAKKMKCLFLDYVQLLMIGQVGRWTQTPSATPLQPKNEMLIFGLLSISGDQPDWSMDSNPSCYPSPAKKWNGHFWITFNFWWSVRLVNGLEPHLPPLSSQKNEMLIFGLCWTSDSRLGWSMDSNPIHHLSPAKEWNAHIRIAFNFWWLAGLVDGLEPHPPPLSIQKNEMLVFGLCSTSDDWPDWTMDSNPSCYPSPAKKWNAHFWITFNFGWSARLVNGLEPHLPPLSSHKNEMLIFGLCSTSDDQPGWPKDSNPICNLFPTKKWNACFCIML